MPEAKLNSALICVTLRLKDYDITLSKILTTILIMILKSNAHQKPSTWKFLTRAPAIRIIKVLMTNRNSPKVRTVIGKDKNWRTGLRIALSIPRTMATRTAEPKLFTDIPGRSHAVK